MSAIWWVFLVLCGAFGLWLLCGTIWHAGRGAGREDSRERIRALEAQLAEAKHLLARGCLCPLPQEAQEAITEAMSRGGFVIPAPRRH